MQKELAIDKFKNRYGQVSGMITKIPESQFNALKLRHYRKVELSKLIDKHPGSLLVILRIKLFVSSFKEKI